LCNILFIKEMIKINQYIQEILGTSIDIIHLPKNKLENLPFFFSEIYKFYKAFLFKQELLLVEYRNPDDLSISQIEKHFNLLKKDFQQKIVLVLLEIASYNRKRLIEKGINFIVPGKQLFLPELLIDLRETFILSKAKSKKEKLLPSAQFLLLYHIIHRNDNWKIENLPFKEIAKKIGYSAMAISKAVDNLTYFKLVTVEGEKEKSIHFSLSRLELWHETINRNLLINPVKKRVYVDKVPDNVNILKCNASALSVYTNMNPSLQMFYALEDRLFYSLQKNKLLINANESEGEYCLEIWKYDPLTLVGELIKDSNVVDPLSLYLSLKESPDERIEMALEQIIEKFIW